MYVDPGSGSMIMTAVVAGAAGAGVVAKTQWRKLTGAFKGKKDAPSDAGNTPEQQ